MRQKGFTLLELLVVMAVGGLLLTGVVTSIFQVFTFTGRSNSQGIALTDLHLAALHIKKDLQMAQYPGMDVGNSVVLSPQNPDNVTLTWFDYTTEFQSPEEQRDHFSTYSLSDNGTLERFYDSDNASIVGRHITYLRFTRQDEKVVNVVITAVGPGIQQREKTIEFSVHMRFEELP